MSEKKKYALVTGASRGIGKAVAEKLHKDGFHVFATATKCFGQNSDYEWLEADFSIEESVAEFLEKIKNMPPIDALVNNAGINIIKPVNDISQEDFRKIINVNLLAPLFTVQSVVKNVRKNGRIVNVASIWAEISKSHRTLYSTTKSAIAGITRSLAAELAEKNILVNTVSPGFTLTDLTKSSLSEDEMQKITATIHLKRMAETNEIASLVSFLVGSENTYITGQNIIIDGGVSIV